MVHDRRGSRGRGRWRGSASHAPLGPDRPGWHPLCTPSSRGLPSIAPGRDTMTDLLVVLCICMAFALGLAYVAALDWLG